MHRLRAPPAGTDEQPALRMGLAREAAADWMAGQGARHGFALGTRPGGAGPSPI